MQRSPQSSVEGSQWLTNGDVVIEPGAAIASGVLLQADPGCQITIRAGVSIATGTILHAHGGPLTIEPGATIGSQVLIVGAGCIGITACIGAEATILNPAIAPGEIVPPRALLGDTSRQVDWSAVPDPTTSGFSPTAAASFNPGSSQPQGAADSAALETAASVGGLSTTAPISLAAPPVYGRAALQQLLATMFPSRQAELDSTPPSNSG